jgi:negative regulator of flagellin synthesis FlgM
MDMKIASVLSAYKVYNTNSIPGQKKVNQTDKTEAKDSFTLSEKAGEYQAVRKALAQVPDVREERVTGIQSRIASGNYQVNANDIAAKMFQGWV